MRKIFIPALTLTAALSAFAQTATTGALTGVVTDTTGAILPGADVLITDVGTGTATHVRSDSSGRYTVTLLKPDTYTVTATTTGLSSDRVRVAVDVSQQAVANIAMSPTNAATTVEVNEEAQPLLDTTTPALVTTFTQQQIENLPAPGGDITTVAYTALGVVVNAGGSYGNFSANGLPSISNLFVFNGFDDQDPFLNLTIQGRRT